MLVIRFFRVGKKNQPSFKIVVTDKRRPPSAGRFVEEVGFYNPLTKEKVLKAERIKHWISIGAKPSATVNNLLIKEKILEGKKIAKHKISKKEPSSVPAVAPASDDLASVAKATSAKEAAAADKETPAGEKTAEVKEEKPAEEPSKEEGIDKKI